MVRATGYRKVGLRRNPVKLLKRAGQPEERPRRSYRYCVRGKKNRKAEVAAVFTKRAKPRVALVTTTARTHRIGAIHPGGRASALSEKAKRLGGGVFVQKSSGKSQRFVFGVKSGKVKFIGVAIRKATQSKKGPAAVSEAGRASVARGR